MDENMNDTNYDYVTAEWARRMTNEVLGVKIQAQIKRCNEAIIIAVNNNLDFVSLDGYFEHLTIEHLAKRGFIAQLLDDELSGYYLKISW